MTFGHRAVLDILHFFNGDLQCFYRIGAYDVCKTTQRLSIDINLFLLMTQSLISRILVPGMSNFVNASVRRLHLSQHALRLNRLAIVTCSTFASLTRTADFEERKLQPIKRCYER